MMTLRLRRCVSLFVCLSLLISACSPDKSSKAGSKANEFNRITKVDKDSVEKIANHVASAVNKNNVTPVGFWNRELGKVGRFSITPTRAVGAVLGTVAVVGSGVWWLGHKKGWWTKPLTAGEQEKYGAHKLREEKLKDEKLSPPAWNQIITVPPPGSSKILSVEETNALKEAAAIQKDVSKVVVGENCAEHIANNVNELSFKAMHMFDVTVNRIADEANKQAITPAIAKTIAESTLTERNFNMANWKRAKTESEKKAFTENEEKVATTAKEAKTTLPQNLQGILKKYISAEMMATRLKTLRNLGAEWDDKGIRQDLNDRMLKINEIVALNAIMATIDERSLNNIMIRAMFNIKGHLVPHDIRIDVFR